MLNLIRPVIATLKVTLKDVADDYVKDHYENHWRYLERKNSTSEATELSSTRPSPSDNVPSVYPVQTTISQVWSPLHTRQI